MDNRSQGLDRLYHRLVCSSGLHVCVHGVFLQFCRFTFIELLPLAKTETLRVTAAHR